MAGLRKALIVANDVYDHEGLKHLVAPAADATALARVLGAPEIGDFDVRVVRNEPAHVIQGTIEDLFSESRPDDVLLVHFSCHGLKSESGELFFAARNTRPNRLASTAVSADFVQRCMRASRSRSIVLLLDCCYGGAFSQGVTVRAAGDVNVLDSFPSERPGGGRGRAVITASSAMEYAFEGDQLADDHSGRPSVFTSALVEGLATGDADRDLDGWVSLNELYDYVFDRVRDQNPHQTPSRDVEMQGELYLARRSRPVTTPAPLPPTLQAAIDHPHPTIRAGAVPELGRLAGEPHPGRALAARLALERLADDDSRKVSAAAAAALGAVDQDRPAASGDVPSAPVPRPARPAGEGALDPTSAAPATGRENPQPGPPTARRLALVFRERRRWWCAGAAALVLAVAAAIAIPLLLRHGGASTADGPLRQEEFTASSPWRLVIRDNISDNNNGCTVTVTNTGTREPLPIPTALYESKSFQIHEAGTFRWSANDPGCLVILRSGAGEKTLPFDHDAGGDTDAFDARGPVTVEVVNFHGNPGCEFVLRDATDGRQLNFGTVRPGEGPLRLDPGRPSRVYVANLHCGARLSAG